MTSVDYAIAIMSILVVCGRVQQECPLSILSSFNSFLREVVFRIPAVAPLLSPASILLYTAAIVGASSLHSMEKCARDSSSGDLSFRSVLIRCQEIVISSSPDEILRNKNQKMLLTTAWLFITKHSSEFADHNPWIELVDEYVSAFSPQPEDVLAVDHGSFADSSRTMIASRIAYSQFTHKSMSSSVAPASGQTQTL